MTDILNLIDNDRPPRPRGWWQCPNDPPCPHGGAVHDVYDADDPLPRCCMEGCDCGKVRV